MKGKVTARVSPKRSLVRILWREEAVKRTTTLHANTLARIGSDAKAEIADLLDRLHILVEMEGRIERLDPLHQLVGQALAGRERMPGMSQISFSG